MSRPPLVYLVYGIADSERRSVIFDLIEGGMSRETQVLYFRPENEPQPATMSRSKRSQTSALSRGNSRMQRSNTAVSPQHPTKSSS